MFVLRSTLRRHAILLLTLLLENVLLAQEPQTAEVEKEFRKAFQEIKQNREQLLSFCLKIRVVDARSSIWNEKQYRTVNLIGYEALGDLTVDSLLICRNDFPLHSQNSSGGSSTVFLRKGSEQFVRSGQAVEKKNGWVSGFFDPLAIGLGYCGEMDQFVAYDQILDNLSNIFKNKGILTFESSSTGERVFGIKRPDGSYSNKCVFQTQLGGSLTEAVFEVGKRTIRVSCGYELQEGIWLPKRALYTCGDGHTMLIEAQWLSVNLPLPQKLFEPLVLSQISGLSLSSEMANPPYSENLQLLIESLK